MAKNIRKMWSVKQELLIKSREAMLSAVQTFNNPNIKFKSESFIILSVIAWTYLLHAYFRSTGIEYRYHRVINNRKKYDKTKRGAYKYWELERCLDDVKCNIDSVTKINLKFLIGHRHEIEHQMTSKIDDYLSARFQACCLNYNTEIKTMFGPFYGIDKHLSFSLQFSSISEDHAQQLRPFTDLPQNIASYINSFDADLSNEHFNDIRFSYRVLYVPKVVSHKGQADKVIEFIRADSPEAVHWNKEYVVIKDREKKKVRATYVWKLMQKKGFKDFGAYKHTLLWKKLDAKNPSKNYGVEVVGTWYWYETWLNEVEWHCRRNEKAYI
ncbi:MAG: DUF3644 domain-containing protein [Flavobacterium sp.]|nr:MAG: DUF3644 domain-containing protein [Flavobacterium sp.]